MDSREQAKTGVTTESAIPSAFKQLLNSRSHRLKAEPVCVLAVVELQRYLAEPNITHPESYSYDVTLTDGVWQVKCTLAPLLNKLVQKNILRAGVDIRITQLSFLYNEKRLGHGSVCIEQMDISSTHSHVLHLVQDVDTIPFWKKEEAGTVIVTQSDAPMQTSRKHYLPLWNNEDPSGPIWIPQIPPVEAVVDVSRIITLRDLEASFGSMHRFPPILVRVMHKSRLRFYGKLETKIDFPYQVYFEVADESGCMSMVLWNALCPEWYQRLNEGVVLYLQNYTLKKGYPNRSRPCLGDPLMRRFSLVEISLNQRDPMALITVIPPKSVQPQWNLPGITYKFITCSEMESLPNNYVCDIIGLVTYVGRCERLRNKGTTVPEKFWMYRWLHAMDGTSDVPFVLEIFASSQPHIFHGIFPMTYLVCTQMRVCRENGTNPYLTSSCETQIFTTGCHKGQTYVSDVKVRNFIQWTKTLKEVEMLKKTTVGGSYCFPPSPPIFTQTLANDSAQFPVTAAGELKRELESMQYREHKRLVFQGQITAVHYFIWPEENQESQVLHSTGAVACRDEEVRVPQSHRKPSPESQPPPHKKHRRKKYNQDTRRHYFTRAAANQQREAECTSRATEENTSTIAEFHEEEEGGSDEGSSLTGVSTQTNVTGAVSPSSSQEKQFEFHPSASWESTAWIGLKENLSEHLQFSSLGEESVTYKFSFEDKEHLLRNCNLHPAKWMVDDFSSNTERNRHNYALCKGYYRVTVLGINKQTAFDAVFVPVLSSEDPRSIGLPQETHDNTMLSCLCHGFLSPLTQPNTQNLHPRPEEIVQTSAELEDLNVVCLLDVCHLGEEKVEIYISKVYKMADVAFV